MAIISTIEVLRRYVKLSFTTTAAQSLPAFDLPEYNYLVPILGSDLYQALSSDISNPTYATLLDYSRALIAPMAIYHDLPFMQALITDTGIKTMSSDTMQAAHRWEYREVREALLDKAGFAAERLVQYLIDNPGEWWSNEAIQNSIFKTGKDFATHYPIYQPYRTLIQLLPIIADVEEHYIRTTIGSEFYNEFKAADQTETNNKTLMNLIKKAVANLTISTAVENLSVKITANGFVVKLSSDGDDPNQGETTASDRLLEMKRASAQETGNRYLLEAKNFLDTNASETVFATYYSSDKYIAPGSDEPDDPNSTRYGVFAL